MRITDEQFEKVRLYFESEQLDHVLLEDDLVDHCCSGIEDLIQTAGHDFNTAFALMKQRLVPNGAREIEQDLEYLENYKPQRTMKKFVFASGYLSTLCIVVGIVMISLSYMKRQRADLDREHTNLEMQVMISGQEVDDLARQKLIENYSINQATWELEALEEALSLFSLGQILLLSAIGLFSLTYLPYQFYKRYQRSALEYSGV